MNEAVQRSPIFPLMARRVGAFCAVFAVGLFACPLLAFAIHPIIPRLVSNFLFFWPQLALVPFGFTHPASDMTRTWLAGGWSYVITGPLWLLVGIVLSWLLRGKAVHATAIAALPVSFAIAVVAFALLGHFDIGVYFEGP